MSRLVLAYIEVDDERAIEEDKGTIDYLEDAFEVLSPLGINLGNTKILDEDDETDARAIKLAEEIFDLI